MKKTTLTFILGTLAGALPALLALHHYRQKDLEKLIDQRLRLQMQIDEQRHLLEEALASLEAKQAKRK